MFFSSEAEAERKAKRAAFEETKVSELTVAQFRALMSQIAYDTDQERQARSRSGLMGRPQIDIE